MAKMAKILCYAYIFHLTWLTSLHYLVKFRFSKCFTSHWICYNQIWCHSEEGILSWQLSCSEATARHWQLVRRRFFYVSARRHLGASSTRIRFPGARERDARHTSSSKHLCPCTRGTFRSRFLTILSRSFMTTNNSAKETIFSLLLLIQSSDTLLQIMHFNLM